MTVVKRIAAADVLARQGFNIGRHLYVDATDISPMCFRSRTARSCRRVAATIKSRLRNMSGAQP